MRTIQYYGPFSAGSTRTIELNTAHRILQIGIEHPHSIPISIYENNGHRIKTSFLIDDKEYAIMDNDILEFDGLFQRKMTIKFLEDVDEYTIISLCFKDVDE